MGRQLGKKRNARGRREVEKAGIFRSKGDEGECGAAWGGRGGGGEDCSRNRLKSWCRLHHSFVFAWDLITDVAHLWEFGDWVSFQHVCDTLCN